MKSIGTRSPLLSFDYNLLVSEKLTKHSLSDYTQNFATIYANFVKRLWIRWPLEEIGWLPM